MTQSFPQRRIIAANSSIPPEDRLRTSAPPQPLPAAEIEALLKMAQSNVGQSRAGVQDEEIGPGDVQYLRGDSTIGPDLTLSDPPIVGGSTTLQGLDSSIRQTEQLLADAILDQRSGARSTTNPATGLDPKPVGMSSSQLTHQGLTLEDLGEVDLDISIELGRTELLIEDVLKLREGSVVSLDKLAGDPVDIIANGRLVARGELLVIDGKFGVRLSEVL